ncbi:UDP-N-acetylmuramate dehydrogenase [Aminipila butyrica]|uniref:UDP-N-acetylenolpyruvoylglucosamine reductase n=2 Tax=Aminipila butyrica TaxID=433296 RepID=A0A858BZV4_9FIRM|nr:UDP-N-acetylmuramate dehydrogenase [Aminipila butyrica]
MKSLLIEINEFSPTGSVEPQVPMSLHTSFRTGGRAEALVTAENESHLAQTLAVLHREQIPHLVLGSGSNVLIKDGGYRGVVIKLGSRFQEIETEGTQLTAGSATKISAAAKAAMEEGLSGLEFASGIPGSIGGGIFMNAGAYGSEVKEILVSATAMAKDGSRTYQLSGSDLELGYRRSAFQKSGDIILRGSFQLQPADKADIFARMKELLDRRNAKQPVQLPSAGSFFKRPEGYYAGKLIEDAGLKGLSVGGAQVSPLHAGFIVNNGEATTADILQLMRLIQNTVYDQFGVHLEPEVRILGED